MKIITGKFAQNEVMTAVYRLMENGFELSDIALLSSAAQIPNYLRETKEEPAAEKAVTSSTPGVRLDELETEAMIQSGLRNIDDPDKIGGYLGSAGKTHEETQQRVDLDEEELQPEKILLLLRIKGDESREKMATALFDEWGGEDVKHHESLNEDSDA